MEYIGYIKYQGPHIQHGLFGAREAATALRGFDEMLRYFLIKEAPELANLKFDLPIKVEEGSWELLTPDAIEHLLYVTAGSGIGFCTLKKYFETAAEIAAKDGIFQTGAAKDARLIFQKAFQMAQWVIKFISHVKGFHKKFTHAKIGENESVLVQRFSQYRFSRTGVGNRRQSQRSTRNGENFFCGAQLFLCGRRERSDSSRSDRW